MTLLYNTKFSQVDLLYSRANLRIREIRENLVLANLLHFSRYFYWHCILAPLSEVELFFLNLIFEPTCASCTVGSYASPSVCLSVCLSVVEMQIRSVSMSTSSCIIKKVEPFFQKVPLRSHFGPTSFQFSLRISQQN